MVLSTSIFETKIKKRSPTFGSSDTYLMSEEREIPGYLMVGFVLILFAAAQRFLAARTYRGTAPTNERPVVFRFSRVWLVGIYALGVFFLVGPYALPGSAEERASAPWVGWLLPLLGVLLAITAEYLRMTQRIEVYQTYFAFSLRGRWHEVRFSEVASVDINGTGLWVKLTNNESYSFATVFNGTGDLVSLLRAKAVEARRSK